tara:strand:+ start:5485 stop:5880 length:396 start_codon:yes stop_codon:yes gene_type:complete
MENVETTNPYLMFGRVELLRLRASREQYALKKAADASKALPIKVLNQDGEETVSNWLDTRRINLNNKMVGLAKDNEETFLGEVTNQAMLGGRTIEKGLEFISGSSSRNSPNRGLKKAINIGIQQALDEEKE